MIKQKKCKGQNKAKEFIGCSKLTDVEFLKYGLCRNCYKEFLFSDLGKDVLASAIIKVQKPRLELEKYAKERKENNSLAYLLKNTVNLCHKYIRERDKGKPCISCGQNWNDSFQSGHFYKAELFSSLKFNEFNINGQCKGCNLYNDGNESGYRVGIINRYSKELLNELDSKALQEKKDGFKWDRTTLKEIQTYYKEKLKDFK